MVNLRCRREERRGRGQQRRGRGQGTGPGPDPAGQQAEPLTDRTEFSKLLLKRLRAKRLDHDRCAGKNSQKTKMEGHGCVKLVQSKGKEKLCIEKYESVLEGKLVKSKVMEKL